MKKDIEVLTKATVDEIKAMRFEYQVNDKLDICVRIRPKNVLDMIHSVFKSDEDKKGPHCHSGHDHNKPL